MSGTPPAPTSLGRLLDFAAEECRVFSASVNGDGPEAAATLLGQIRALAGELAALERVVSEAPHAG